MKCGFCGQNTAPLGMTWSTSGERLIVLVCGRCQAVLGAANADLSDKLDSLERRTRQVEAAVGGLRR
jgi:protein-arginine kinase activator protein McsA